MHLYLQDVKQIQKKIIHNFNVLLTFGSCLLNFPYVMGSLHGIIASNTSKEILLKYFVLGGQKYIFWLVNSKCGRFLVSGWKDRLRNGTERFGSRLRFWMQQTERLKWPERLQPKNLWLKKMFINRLSKPVISNH